MRRGTHVLAHRGVIFSPIPVLDLGVAPYLPVQDLQMRLRHAVADGAIPAVILVLEHEPVITLGKRGLATDIRRPQDVVARGVVIVESERGGQVTLHAPGQLVTYPIMPIPQRDVRPYVFALEEVLSRVLLAADLTPSRRSGRPGLYLDGAKVASLGLRCERGVASHGTSLNVDIDLSLFDLVTACGEPDVHQTSMRAALGRPVTMAWVKQAYLVAFRAVFGSTLAPMRALPYDQVGPVVGIDPASPSPTNL
ncbi:MAG: lipoyl(octanoyl) transferase [Acidobacteria bacterium RBG_16_64_8]|nr:MAG: lipoyl(octanoyl) transferase [Acidobacteria bacterium RBG_16_64_8]